MRRAVAQKIKGLSQERCPVRERCLTLSRDSRRHNIDMFYLPTIPKPTYVRNFQEKS